jgi:hypothetical protein
MITPTKGVSAQRALLAVGAQVLQVLNQPMTVSQLWTRVQQWRREHSHTSPIPFWWFVLALDLLYAVGAVDLDHDLLTRRPADVASVGGQ